jgi:hypothetical protein
MGILTARARIYKVKVGKILRYEPVYYLGFSFHEGEEPGAGEKTWQKRYIAVPGTRDLRPSDELECGYGSRWPEIVEENEKSRSPP